MKLKDPIELRCALRHFVALASMHGDVKLGGYNSAEEFGMSLWQKLRRVEVWVGNQCVQYSNDSSYGTERWEKVVHTAARRVRKILNPDGGGLLPEGFFVNSDPRGYMLKIDSDGADPAEVWRKRGMHWDGGNNAVLAPEVFR